MKVANLKDAHVLTFCNGISTGTPMNIPYAPVVDEPFNECVSIVKEHVARHGGSAVYGWSIWEWPGVLIEAEFHVAWQSVDNGIVDITPKPVKFKHTTFIPDPEIKYRGVQINNIRKPLIDSAIVREYIQSSDAIFEELNKPYLTDDQGKIIPSERLTKHYNVMTKLQPMLLELS
jgi:hypothetical protein